MLGQWQPGQGFCPLKNKNVLRVFIFHSRTMRWEPESNMATACVMNGKLWRPGRYAEWSRVKWRVFQRYTPYISMIIRFV